MTTIAKTDPSEKVASTGRIVSVKGPVVDVEFPSDGIPPINQALHTTVDAMGQPMDITLEVAQHLGDDVVRTISLKPTDGLVRGQQVEDTGSPIKVPVGQATLGHVFDVTGDLLNGKPGETFAPDDHWSIHREPP
ncbi:MAG: F0F1 ATP synthase subunit beta, partial [Microbacteriaceae bacterium]|nr:F0F1 ATP synthase subunit beta [Microbacteriaceae bacterium]